MGKILKVKDIAKQYGVPVKSVIEELAGQGIEANDAENSVIPDDMIELVEMYFADLYDQDSEPAAAADKKPAKKGGKKPPAGRREEHGGDRGKGSPHKGGRPQPAAVSSARAAGGKVTLPAPIIVKALAEAVGKKPNELITDLIKLGELAGINQPISEANARKLCASYGYELEIGAAPKPAPAPAAPAKPKPEDNPANLKERPPVVTFMGHVDHGKTSLQDAVRHTHVTAQEAGAITQHIGASTVTHNGKPITFIDTPGHAAFTNMRARGANLTDIVVLVVSATEGFKPQTVEAMNHAKAAKVPIIVAINKIDLPEADPDKILLHMQQNGLTSEDWGGDVGTVRVSAKTGQGLPDLLDRILLEAEILELKANPKRRAAGAVLEAQMEVGLGPRRASWCRTARCMSATRFSAENITADPHTHQRQGRARQDGGAERSGEGGRALRRSRSGRPARDLRIRESGAGRGAGAGRRQTRQHARHQRHRNGGGPVQQAQQQ
ncbi:MAG: translation initiation factor IF-2 N-terminal domain-containing protein [Victivallis sp.]